MAGRLGDILVTRGVITEEQLENALVSGQRGMLDADVPGEVWRHGEEVSHKGEI